MGSFFTYLSFSNDGSGIINMTRVYTSSIDKLQELVESLLEAQRNFEPMPLSVQALSDKLDPNLGPGSFFDQRLKSVFSIQVLDVRETQKLWLQALLAVTRQLDLAIVMFAAAFHGEVLSILDQTREGIFLTRDAPSPEGDMPRRYRLACLDAMLRGKEVWAFSGVEGPTDRRSMLLAEVGCLGTLLVCPSRQRSPHRSNEYWQRMHHCLRRHETD